MDRLRALIALVAVMLLAGCVAGGLPDRKPDMSRARVADVSNIEGQDLVLSLELDRKGAAFDKASVQVDEKTRVFRQKDAGSERTGREDLLGSQLVDVWFEGPVAESYPVQARAGTVVILE